MRVGENDQGVTRPTTAPEDRYAARGRDVIAGAKRRKGAPTTRSEEWVLRRRGDRMAKRCPHAIHHSLATRGGGNHTPPPNLEMLVTHQRLSKRDASRDDILDPNPCSALGIDHPCVSYDALGEAIERERGDGVDDLLGGVARDALARHARAQLRLDIAMRARCA